MNATQKNTSSNVIKVDNNKDNAKKLDFQDNVNKVGTCQLAMLPTGRLASSGCVISHLTKD
eukprot:1091983-Amphidinium_carterae.2